jgi:SAM-dependent methyltransferase
MPAGVEGGAGSAGPITAAGPRPRPPDPYEDAELYDRVFAALDFDVAFWRALARRAGGPVLEIGCGTGRLMLPMLEAGADVDGLDLAPAMLEALRRKAAARGFTPHLAPGDMRDFTMPRRYALIAIAFNAFLHNLTAEDQLATLRCCREHLDDGGALVMHVSFFTAQAIAAAGGAPVLELETRDPATGHLLQHYDTRTLDPVRQLQHSVNEVRELDAAGGVVGSRFTETDLRWIHPPELDLLLRIAGFQRRELHGGFDGEPVGADGGMMIAFAWKD